MTNDEIEKFPFRYYTLSTTLNQASLLLKCLVRSEDIHLNQASPNWEMKSEAQAEARGITQWHCYNRALYCNKPKHFSNATFIQTPLGWIHYCCAKELNLVRLPNTYMQPTEKEIRATYLDKKNELGMIIEYLQRKAAIKSAAIRKANAQKSAEAKELKIAEKVAKKLAMTPKEVEYKKAVRAEKKAEKALKLALGLLPNK